MKWLARYWQWIVGIGTIVLFVAIKIAGFQVRMGDTWPYFAMAKAISQGLIPYRDFFLADPPLLEYLLAPFAALPPNLTHYASLVSAVIEASNALLVLLMARRWKLKFFWLAPLLYLFSFTILATSDFVTGAQVTTFFLMLGLLLETKPISSGIFFGLSALTKLYAAPAIIGFWLAELQARDWKKLLIRTSALIGVVAIVMVPFLIADHRAVFDQLVWHQFGRPRGTNKLEIFTLFLQAEWLLISGAAIGGYLYRKTKLIYPLFLNLLFLLIYQDLYYVYVELLIAWMVLLSIAGLSVATKRFATTSVLTVALPLIAFWLILNIGRYFTIFYPQAVFHSRSEIAAYLASLPPKPVYGVHEITPLLSLQTGLPLADHQFDTNTRVFDSGAQSVAAVSQRVAAEDFYLIIKAIDRPELGIFQPIYTGFFDRELFEKNCQELQRFANSPVDLENTVAVYACSRRS